MTLFKVLFLTCLLIVIQLFPISFLVQQYPYLYTNEYEYFSKELFFDFQKFEFQDFETTPRVEKMKQIFLWYFNIPSFNIIPSHSSKLHWLQKKSLLQLSRWQGKGIKVAVLDTNIPISQSRLIECISKNHYLNYSRSSETNLSSAEKLKLFNKNIEDQEKRLSYKDIKIHISQSLLEKNHGINSMFCIKQIAPAVDILSIPVLDDKGLATITSLLNGVQKAVEARADILYLGLRVQNIDRTNPVFKKICTLFDKFSFVVVAAGNKDEMSTRQLFMNCKHSNRIISVGAFKKEGNLYPVCTFSESKLPLGPHVLMPGQDIICPIWIEKINDFVWAPIHGTSMAAAFMSGCLAVLLSECDLQLTNKQIRFLVKASCDQQDIWKTKSLWGTFNLPKILFTLKVLQEISKKIKWKNDIRVFESIVDRVMFYMNQNNVDVKTKNSYTQFLFNKKFDSDLAILVEDSIKHVKEFL